jgi:hypothetical protein
MSLLLLIGVAMAGCGLQKQSRLGRDDFRFAAFYGDYLARSGVTVKDGATPAAELTSAGLDTLFVRHGLDQKTFDARLQAYSSDPELWRKVLLEVRRNIQKNPQ